MNNPSIDIQSKQATEAIQEAPTTVSEAISEATTKPDPEYKKFMLPTIVVLVIIILSIGAYFIYQNQTATNSVSIEPTPSPIAEKEATESAQTNMAQIDTSDWKTYTDEKTGFSFKYPQSVLINPETKDNSAMVLTVAVDKIDDIPEELPLSMGRQDAIKLKQKLANGDVTNLVKLGSLNGSVSYGYSQFEICSVYFNRTLTFFPGEYRVMLSFDGPKDKIIAAEPDYFTVNAANCGESKIWKEGATDEFEAALQNNQGQGIAQEWYDTFMGIVGTVEIFDPTSQMDETTSDQADDNSSTADDGTETYENDQYGIELTYSEPYKLLNSKDDLYGYPNGIALLYAGGQAYDIVIEVWDSQAEYENSYGPRASELIVFQNNGKYITVLDNTKMPGNKAIIDSVKVGQ